MNIKDTVYDIAKNDHDLENSELQELNKIESPKMPNREQWLYSLLGSQFTLSEMKSGFAYKYINEV